MKWLNRLLRRVDTPDADDLQPAASFIEDQNTDVPASSDSGSSPTQTDGDALRPVYTLVPGARPIELVDYYLEFTSYYPECELQTKRWFVENVKDDWIVFDIGANVGYYSILFSRLAPSGRIFAFEPTETIKKLNTNIDHHGCTNVIALECALGAVAGRIEEDVYRIWGQPPERMTYTFSTVDKMVRELQLTALDCLKIDVDSFDFEVLQGAEETLARFDPWVVVELNHALARRNHSPPEAFQWLMARGYNAALVLDHENFVFRRADQRPGTGLPKLELAFDTRPVFLEPSREKAGERINLFAAEPRAQDNGTIESNADPLQIEVRGPRWTFAADWPLVNETPDPVLVEVDAFVEGGDIAFSFIGGDGSIFGETILHAGDFRQTAILHKPEATPIRCLLLRNVDTHSTTARTKIFQIRCFDSVPARSPSPPSILGASISSISTRDMAEALGAKTKLGTADDSIDVVAVETLGQVLGFTRPFIPTSLYRHSLAHWNTERDETSIFEYIYGNFRPRRHLEIGTWEGHGTATVARMSDAEIWTVNLPEGERDESGAPKYALIGDSADPLAPQPSDAGTAIGWRYREAGFAPRVHQILCNSLDLDVAQWASGFFDTIFIDGGHTTDVVISDTEKTLSLLRSGGLMIWHDFCPEPLTLSRNEAPRGVVAAVATNLAKWRPQFAKMFWIRPSWILVGVKK